MDQYVKVGIIGVGGIARGAHITGLQKVKEAKIIAICDIDEKRLNQIGDEAGIPAEKRYLNYEDLIRDPDVEAVEICTPNHLHVPMAVAALKAGKHVNVEKPVSTDYDSTAPLAEVLKEIDPTAFLPRFATRNGFWIRECWAISST